MNTEQPYTPSEDDVRAVWVVHERDCGWAPHPGDPSADFDRFIAQVRRDAVRDVAQMIRDACDRWEVDGDDERLVNEVLDPWTTRVLNPEEPA